MSLSRSDLEDSDFGASIGTPLHLVTPDENIDAVKGVVRPLKRGDREPLRQLLIETDVFTPDEIEIALELIDTAIEKTGQEDYIVNVYDDGGEVLGYYCIGPTPATNGTFDLYWIAVKPSAHRRGIGASLNAHAERLIRSQGGRLVIAETSSQARYEKTRRFYVNQGYSQLARVRDYYRVGDDLVVFGKYLT